MAKTNAPALANKLLPAELDLALVLSKENANSLHQAFLVEKKSGRAASNINLSFSLPIAKIVANGLF